MKIYVPKIILKHPDSSS